MTTTIDAPHHNLAGRLYHGETAFDFVGRRRRWFALSGLVILVGLLALGVRGLNFGIDFKGGTSWEVPAKGVSVTRAQEAVGATGVKNATVQTLKGPNGTDLRVEAKITPVDQDKVTRALAQLTHGDINAVNVSSVGPTWGHEITHKAEVALIAFFIAVGLFITFRFQAKMAVAAIIAVIHDILVTVGVYAVFGFDVTPNTVIALLTILGYSLYDTVVVFDKVDENTRGLAASGRMTYSDTVNLSMNQVLMRSINTSLVAILPILSVLIIGDVFLGATTLKEFGLALFVGLLTGAYSSIFIAAPILAGLKEREPRYATIRQRLESRGAAGTLLTPRAAAEQSAGGAGSRTRAATAATAVLVDEEDDDDDIDGPAILRPGQGRDRDDEPARPARAAGSASRAAQPGRPAANRPRPGAPRPAPRGRKKGGKRR
jgi:preprotein translocase subunit SecF